MVAQTQELNLEIAMHTQFHFAIKKEGEKERALPFSGRGEGEKGTVCWLEFLALKVGGRRGGEGLFRLFFGGWRKRGLPPPPFI